MGGYLQAALAAMSFAKDKYSKQKQLYNTEKELGSPWWKQMLGQAATFVSSNPVWSPTDWYQRNRQGHLNDLQAKARNSTGVGGEAALKTAANSTRAIMNAQLQQNIDTINTDYGTAGRYGSGANKQAVLQAQNSTNFNLANVVNQMSLQSSQFQQNLAEQHAQFQANLDASKPSTASQIGDIANLGVQLYGSNPDYFNQKLSAAGDKLGIGGDVYATPSAEPRLNTGMMNVNPGQVFNTGQPGVESLLPSTYPAPQKSLSVPDFMKVPVEKYDTTSGQTYLDYVDMQPAQKEVIKQQVLSTPPDVMIEDSKLAPKLSVALEMAKTEDIRRLIAKYNGTQDWEGFFQELQSIMGGGTNGGNSVSNTK